MLEEMEGLYQAYIDEFHRLERKRKPLEGAFGFGGGPQSYPCHEQFAQDLERLLRELAARSSSSSQVSQVLNYIYFSAPAGWESEPAVNWMLLAVHGLTMELIPLLDAPDAETLCSTYQAAYPRRSRLPAQDRVLAALRKQCN